MNLEVLKDFRDILQDNIKNMDKGHLSEDSSISFFQSLLSINYLYKNKESYNFASDVFKYNEILTKENYFKIKNYIKGLFEAQFPEKEFDDKGKTVR